LVKGGEKRKGKVNLQTGKDGGRKAQPLRDSKGIF